MAQKSRAVLPFFPVRPGRFLYRPAQAVGASISFPAVPSNEVPAPLMKLWLNHELSLIIWLLSAEATLPPVH